MPVTFPLLTAALHGWQRRSLGLYVRTHTCKQATFTVCMCVCLIVPMLWCNLDACIDKCIPVCSDEQ